MPGQLTPEAKEECMTEREMPSDLLLVGAGNMAADYVVVLTALGIRPTVFGRGAVSAARFAERTGLSVGTGQLEAQIAAAGALPDTAIVAVNALHLAEVTTTLVENGVKRILVEKPGALDRAELDGVVEVSARNEAEVVLGYNRRFIASVIAADRMIAEDGGVLSVKFDFSEPARRIATLDKPQREFDTWFYGNSSHVVDLAFHFFGQPVALDAQVAGEAAWHKAAGIFSGTARNAGGALMSWHANWIAPGRWGVEVMTPERRLILQPIEKLRVQSHAGFAEEDIPLDDAEDRDFKPGLMKQVRAFLTGNGAGRLQTLAGHAAYFPCYEDIRTGARYRRPD